MFLSVVRLGSYQSNLRAGEMVSHRGTCSLLWRRDGSFRWPTGLHAALLYHCLRQCLNSEGWWAGLPLFCSRPLRFWEKKLSTSVFMILIVRVLHGGLRLTNHVLLNAYVSRIVYTRRCVIAPFLCCVYRRCRKKFFTWTKTHLYSYTLMIFC